MVSSPDQYLCSNIGHIKYIVHVNQPLTSLSLLESSTRLGLLNGRFLALKDLLLLFVLVVIMGFLGLF